MTFGLLAKNKIIGIWYKKKITQIKNKLLKMSWVQIQVFGLVMLINKLFKILNPIIKIMNNIRIIPQIIIILMPLLLIKITLIKDNIVIIPIIITITIITITHNIIIIINFLQEIHLVPLIKMLKKTILIIKICKIKIFLLKEIKIYLKNNLITLTIEIIIPIINRKENFDFYFDIFSLFNF
jgi:hypothetical protein